MIASVFIVLTLTKGELCPFTNLVVPSAEKEQKNLCVALTQYCLARIAANLWNAFIAEKFIRQQVKSRAVAAVIASIAAVANSR